MLPSALAPSDVNTSSSWPLSWADLSPGDSAPDGDRRGRLCCGSQQPSHLCPPAVGTFGWAVQTQALRNCAGRSRRATFTRTPPSLPPSPVVFIQDEGCFPPQGWLRLCVPTCNAFLSSGPCSASYWARSFVQRQCTPQVHYILVLTGLNISTVFAVSPVL